MDLGERAGFDSISPCVPSHCQVILKCNYLNIKAVSLPHLKKKPQPLKGADGCGKPCAIIFNKDITVRLQHAILVQK